MQLQMKADLCTRVRFKMGQPALTPNNKHPPTPRLHQPRNVQLENTMQAPLMYTNWTVGIHFQTIDHHLWPLFKGFVNVCSLTADWLLLLLAVGT